MRIKFSFHKDLLYFNDKLEDLKTNLKGKNIESLQLASFSAERLPGLKQVLELLPHAQVKELHLIIQSDFDKSMLKEILTPLKTNQAIKT